MLVIKGTIAGKRAGEYEGRKYASLQFIERNDKGAIDMVEVNLPDGYEHSDLREDTSVEIPVRISAKNGKVYYRMNGPLNIIKTK